MHLFCFTFIIFMAGMAISCGISSVSHAQNTEDTPHETRTIQDRFPDKEAFSKRDKIVTLAVENDSLGGRGSDQNFTSGVRLSYFDINADLPSWADEVADLVPTFDVNKTTSLFYSVGQNLYTPEDIENPIADPDDRPWAAFLYGSVGMVTITDNHLDTLELTLGVVGPEALGEPVQEFVHELIGSPDPAGWDNQLNFEPGLMLSWERRFPALYAVEFQDLHLSAAPYGGITLGNIHTYANTGFNIQLVPKDAIWQDVPLRVRPAQPSTGFYELSEDNLSWALFAGAETRAVGRNIFLDGNTFESSPSIDKNYIVADFHGGIATTLGRSRLSYTLNYRTKEFKGQDSGDLFGALSFSRRF